MRASSRAEVGRRRGGAGASRPRRPAARLLLAALGACVPPAALAGVPVESQPAFHFVDAGRSGGALVRKSLGKPGWAKLHNGPHLRGELELTVVGLELVEIRIRTPAGPRSFAPAGVEAYGLDPVRGERHDRYREPARNFHPGAVVHVGGLEERGRVALDGGRGDDLKTEVYFLAEGQRVAIAHPTGRLHSVSQVIDGVVHTYDAYRDGFLRRIVSGRLTLYRDPEAARQLAYRGGGMASSESREQYLVHGPASPSPHVVDFGNYRDFAAGLLEGCPAFDALDPAARRRLMRFGSIAEAIAFHNERCEASTGRSSRVP